MKSRSEFDCQYDWLFYIYNNLGCTNIQICGGGKNSKGDIYFTRRYFFEELIHLNPWDIVFTDRKNKISKKVKDFINDATHRTVLDIELCIDVDEPGDCKTIKDKTIQIKNKLDKIKAKYYIYFTGSKSYHIHVFDKDFRYINMNHRLKSLFLISLGADGMKGSSKQTIAIEGAKHYRSGVIKQEVKI